jgi:D-amino-acid dehydrogenase
VTGASQPRDAIVVGAGLMGVATAHALLARGYRTTLVEAREGVALETSHANGAMLVASMPDPWNAPGVHRHLATSLFDPHSPMKLRLAAVPSLTTWGIRFLRNSTAARHAAATRANYALARYSVAQTRELRERLGLRYDASTAGTMKIFREAGAMEGPLALARMLAPLGLEFAVLDADGAVAAEPALADVHGQIAGALRFPGDEAGDAFTFCESLAAQFERGGGVVRRSTRVRGLTADRAGVTGVALERETLSAPLVVVAAGNGTERLVRSVGLRLPIRPAKGYTLTFDQAPAGSPRLPVVDDALHAAVVPLGSRLRIAGTAEFAGNDLSIRRERIENLVNLLRAMYPGIAARLDLAAGRPWTGLRPMSADGLPFIGATRIRGLYVNAGHGHLGWTLAVGSARLLADALDGRAPEIDPTPYAASR